MLYNRFQGSLAPPYFDVSNSLRFPQPQEAILAVCGDQVHMWVVSDTNYIFLVNLWVQRKQMSTLSTHLPFCFLIL